MVYKVITLNIWEGGKLLPDLLKFLKKESPDILALQEVRSSDDPKLSDQDHSFAVIKQELAMPYGDFAAAMLNNLPAGKIPQGNAVLSKYPLERQNVLFFNRPFDENYFDVPEKFAECPRIMQVVDVETPDGKVHIGNVHGIWDLDGDNDSVDRQKMARDIIEATKGKSPYVVLGDTNAKMSNPSIKAIEEYLVNIFASELTSSFNMRRKTSPGYATAAVDMILITPDIQVVSKSVPDVDISDHLPVIANLTWGTHGTS